MKKILLSILTLGIGAFALNAQTLDQSNTASTSSTWLVNSGGNTSNGQSFTAGMNGFMSSISINIDASNSFLPILAGDFTLTIRSGNGYGGTILGVDTFSVTGTEPSGFLSIPIKPNTVAITTGSSYTYIIDEISGTGQLNIAASSNSYAGGDLYSQVFTNPATVDGTSDFIFETYVTTPNCTVDQQHIGTDTRQALIGSDSFLEGQSFRAGISGQLNSVDLELIATNGGCAISNMNVKVEILDGDGLSGTMLASEIVSLSTNFPRTMTSFSFSNPASIVANQLYTITFSLVSGQSCGAGEPQLNWFYQFPSSFSNSGGRHYRNGSMPSMGDASYFKTCVSACLADQAVAAAQTTICNGDSTTINVGSTEVGVNYTLRNDADSSIVGSVVAGTGAAISLPTGSITATTTYNVLGVKMGSNSAVDLSGTTDVIQFTNPFYTYTNEITIESWVDFKGSHLRAGQATAGVDNNASNVWLWDGGGFLVNDNGSWMGLLFPSSIPSGWVHVATVANASGMFIYYNGVLVASNTSGITSGIRNTSNSVIDLGHDPRFPLSVRNTNHSFDNFRVWNTARTATEISDNMNNCLTAGTPNLVQYAEFEEGTGTTLSSLVGVNGIIINPSSAWINGVFACPLCELEMTQMVTITVLPALTGTNNTTICNSDSVVINGTTYNAFNPTGTEVFTNVGANNCDSTVTVALNVLPAIDNTTTLNVNTISANQTGATYQWLDCDNSNAVIAGATAQNYVVTATGNYAVEITTASCVDTSACVNVIITSINELSKNNVNIYPNPTNGKVTIQLANATITTDYSIYAIDGKIVASGTTKTNTIVVDLSNESKGVYFVKLNTTNSSTVHKLIKQ